MWQHHYVIHAMRMDALRAEAERELRWRLADEEHGRPARRSAPGSLRAAAARLAAAVGRFADRAARRLDGAVDLGTERLIRDRASADRSAPALVARARSSTSPSFVGGHESEASPLVGGSHASR